MKRGVKEKREKKKMFSIYILIFIVLLVVVFAFILEKDKLKLTGKATQGVSLNISVGAPQIVRVENVSAAVTAGPNAATNTYVLINFTGYNSVSAGNLNHSSAKVNFSISGGEERLNSTCQLASIFGTYYANYSCAVEMWWWDPTGTWTISATIRDNETNIAVNSSQTLSVGERTAFVSSPGILTWAGLSPGATNSSATNDPVLLNNTGNDVITPGSIFINSSNLRGETIATQALWARNFSVGWISGSECYETNANLNLSISMNGTFANMTIANLTAGNYSINDGKTGQEQLYFCLRIAGTELSTQAYSTANASEGAWTIRTQ